MEVGLSNMVQYVFLPGPSPETFRCTGRSNIGSVFKLSGSVSKEADEVIVQFDKDYGEYKIRYTGTLDRDFDEITGTFVEIVESHDYESDPLQFILHPMSPSACQTAVSARPSTYPLSEKITAFETVCLQLRDAEHHAGEHEADKPLLLLEGAVREKVMMALTLREVYGEDSRTAGSELIRRILPDTLREYYAHWSREKDGIMGLIPDYE